MNIEILTHAVEKENYYPLTLTRDLEECTVANLSLHAARDAELAEARFHQTADRDRLVLFIHGNAWLSAKDLRKIKLLDCATVIRTPDDEVLAWTASSTIVGDSADAMRADDSLLIQHSWDLLKLNEILLDRMREDTIDGTLSPGVHVDGHVSVGSGTRILPGTYIEGNVVIGSRCKIGPNCYLRGPTSIGDCCHVGNGVEIKASILMDGASIGHLSYVGDSIIGRRTNFGAGTITANFRHDGKTHRTIVGAKLVDTGRRKLGTITGDGVHTGINTSIYPGRKLWPGASTLPGDIVSRDIKS